MQGNTELIRRKSETIDLLLQRFSGVVQVTLFLIDFLSASKKDNKQNPDAISEYRSHMLRSRHYALELKMYSQTVKLFARDLRKIGISIDEKELSDGVSNLSRLLTAVEDCLLAGYAYDDFIDNSPLRGSNLAYHLIKSKEFVIDLYENTKLNLFKLLLELKVSSDNILHVENVIAEYEQVADAEDASHYYKIDLSDYHSVENMLSILDQKAKSLSALGIVIVEAYLGINIPEDWKSAFKHSFSCAWLINDLHKNETETGIGNWIELKGGRLPLPIVIAIHGLKDQDRQRIIEVITRIWEIYNPIFTGEMNKDVLEQIEQVDQTDESIKLFLEFKSLLIKSGVKQFISSELEKRLKIVRNISSKYRGLSSLSFFLTALDGYKIEKKSKSLVKKIKSKLVMI